jgi:tetratricopeptide (TPR) repeat protein
MLVMLDNARDERQVRPLLPGSPGSVAVITSRSQLTSLLTLEGARAVPVGTLAPAEAGELLARRLGSERAAAEQDAVAELTRLCAFLPLALAVVAARAASRPAAPLGMLAAELRDSAGRLNALEAGDAASSVRAAFSWSYRQLTEPAARMFRLLGVHPGPDISVPAAASLAGTGLPEARASLGELARACLVGEPAPGRHAVHDLLRHYAAEQARARGQERERHRAVTRMLDHYLHTAASGALLLDPDRDQQELRNAVDGTVLEPLSSYQQALAWFDSERAVLLGIIGPAGEAGFDTFACHLPEMLTCYLYRRGNWPDITATQRAALAAAQRLGSPAHQATAHFNLGRSLCLLREYRDADIHLRHAMRFFGQLGDHSGMGRCHYAQARLSEAQARWEDALRHAQRALAELREEGRRERAACLNKIGWAHAHLGRYQQALSCCRRAMAMFSEAGSHNGEAAAWDSLGYAHRQLGQHPEAIVCYERAVSLFREVGNSYHLAGAFTGLGDVHHALGHSRAAAIAWGEALAILGELDHPDAAALSAKLGLPAPCAPATT